MIRIMLADDHRLLREGLRLLIGKEKDMEVIAEAENGRVAVRVTKDLKPDIVIMDIMMPEMNGIDATRIIVRKYSGVKVIGLSMHSDRRFILGMLEAGAAGYLTKNCAFDELPRAVRSVALGQKYISPRITGVIVEGYLSKEPLSSTAHGVLTPREREILQLVAEGMAAKEIAVRLNVSVKTVETHRRNMMEKLNTRSVAELTKHAVREGIISID